MTRHATDLRALVDGMSLDDRQRLALHTQAALPARAFLVSIWGECDLLRAWAHTDPLLRISWVQRWLFTNRAECRRLRWNLTAVIEAFTVDRPDDPRWRRFALDTMRELRQWGLSDAWAASSDPGPHGPDTQVVYFLPPDVSAFELGTAPRIPEFLMRYDFDHGWRVLNPFSGEVVPEPGWPPRLEEDVALPWP